MEERKNTSLSVFPSIWKKVKIRCIEHGEDVSDYVMNLIRKDLKLSE